MKKMKPKILKLSTVVLLFAFISAGCQDENEHEGIPLEYVKCLCDHETEFIKTITYDSILLFDASITSIAERKELAQDGDCAKYISYNKTDTTFFYSICGTMTGVSYVCNFPEIAKDWEIPKNGIIVSYSADVFKLCDLPMSISTHTYAMLVLTFLKKHEL